MKLSRVVAIGSAAAISLVLVGPLLSGLSPERPLFAVLRTTATSDGTVKEARFSGTIRGAEFRGAVHGLQPGLRLLVSGSFRPDFSFTGALQTELGVDVGQLEGSILGGRLTGNYRLIETRRALLPAEIPAFGAFETATFDPVETGAALHPKARIFAE